MKQKIVDLFATQYKEAREKALYKQQVMNTKAFNYGTLVTKKKSTNADKLFGFGEVGSVGVVVGHYELEGNDGAFFGKPRNMYRVYWSENSPYQGEQFEHLELYKGEIPEHLKHVTWNDIYIDFTIKGDGFNL